MEDTEAVVFETKTQLLESQLKRFNVELERLLARIDYVAGTPVIQDHILSLRKVEAFLTHMHWVLQFESLEKTGEPNILESLDEVDTLLLKHIRLHLIQLKATVTALDEKLALEVVQPRKAVVQSLLRYRANRVKKSLTEAVRRTLSNTLSLLDGGFVLIPHSGQYVYVSESLMKLLAKFYPQDV